MSAIGNSGKKIYGVQFHPEVVHTKRDENTLKISSKSANAKETGAWKISSMEKLKRLKASRR